MLHARTDGTNVGMLVGVNVDAAVVEGAAPGAVVDEDGVAAPTEACTVPAEDSEGGADGDGRAEADGGAADEAGSWGVKDDCGIVDGHVVVGRIDGLNLDVAIVVDDVVVGVGGEVAVVVCFLTLALDGVHDSITLAENRVAQGPGPLRVARHCVEHGGEGQECQDAGVPWEIVGLDGLGEGVAGEVAVLLGPGGGVWDLVPEG